jgi:hypothetical protein
MLCINISKIWVGLRFGRFFQKLIWSPWFPEQNGKTGSSVFSRGVKLSLLLSQKLVACIARKNLQGQTCKE